MGRIVSAGLGRAGWAESAGLDLHKPKRWAEPVRRSVSGEDEVGRRRGVRRPRMAVPASGRRGDGTGDGGEYRLGYAVLGRGVTRPWSARIVGKFRFLARFLSFPTRDFPNSIAGNRGN
ncbi:hypothetical protein CDL15_Pgr000302 [Punica granatum]|uniref:Uncharacterized protein n=1 Tax=Punica granatum TaxID=22663 RepID=A0A218Y2S5_PUNGR|nr:hypothetical protein CDL15_Pgr000302 [Punica granatum]PKI64490.1 hypothetical protein CRG98_015126 [Punica granatum]